MRTNPTMKRRIVDINAQQRYRTTLFGTLYADGLCEPADGFLDARRSIGRPEPYEADVSREEGREDASEE